MARFAVRSEPQVAEGTVRARPKGLASDLASSAAGGRPVGLARTIVVVFGALVVLQSSQELGILKIAYLVVASIVVLASILNVRRMWRSTVVAAARPWLIASSICAALVILSLPVAVARGTPISAWIRDAAAYGLLIAAPWLAVDMALSASRRALLAVTFAAGAATTVSYAVFWIQRRHIADFSIDRLALPSLILASALFAVALALAVSSDRHRYWWTAAAALTIGLLVFSGTRSSLALLLVCPITLFASWRSDRGTPIRPRLLIAMTPAVVAIMIVGATQIRLAGGSPAAGSGPGTATGGAGPNASAAPPGRSLTERYDSIGTVLAGRDPSLQERLSQTRAVWAVFLMSPIVGGGLGVPIPWTDSTGVIHTDNAFTADTPVLVLAKFGLLGLALIAALGWAAITTIRGLGAGKRATGKSWLATIAFATAILVLMPFGWQLEDKGTALALVLVLGFGLVELRESGLPPETLDADPAIPTMEWPADGVPSRVAGHQ
jgi:hypothetical protein